jgi:hypothetical protein
MPSVLIFYCSNPGRSGFVVLATFPRPRFTTCCRAAERNSTQAFGIPGVSRDVLRADATCAIVQHERALISAPFCSTLREISQFDP